MMFSSRIQVVANALAATLIMSSVGSQPVAAANVYISEGVGGQGSDAWFELDGSDHLQLGIVNCKKRRGQIDFGLRLTVNEKEKVSPELEKLRDAAYPSKRNYYFCINRMCEQREWDFSEMWGWSTTIQVDQRRQKINSIRVVIPDDKTNYEFQGDVETVLKKICR